MKILLLLLLINTSACYAQNQERTVFFYNVGFGGVSSGIGALINKQKGSNWKKVFAKAFLQGSVGGLMNYSSKKILYLNNFKQTNNFYWPAKILHSAGSSIIENAALNEPFLQNWNIDYGPVRFDFSINHKKNFKVRFLPNSIYAIIEVSKYGKFDFKSTIETGNVIFSNDTLLKLRNGGTEIGLSFGRAVVFVDNNNIVNRYKILTHEIVHQFQYSEYEIFNTWLKPIGRQIKSKLIQKVFNKYVYTDIPYHYLTYYLAGHYNYPHYFRNFYEFEAERFSTNKFVSR